MTGEAAAAVGVSSVTLLRWAHEGKVTPALITAGGHYRWRIDDLRRQLRRLNPVAQPIVAAIVTSDRGVLIERRHDGRPLWTFPAGEAEPGESPIDTAIRETKEETGLEIKVSHKIGERQHPATGRHMIYLAARPYQSTAVHVGDEAELAEVRWVSLAEADQLMPDVYEPVREHLVHALGRHS
jgi:8-oxo-dGTP diphosphatase